MKNTLKISLKPNEKIYINGAVIRVDRKVSIELLNDVQFLLENHVLQADEASTPLRQLYFILQVMLMNPDGADEARDDVPQVAAAAAGELRRRADPGALKQIDRLVGEDHVYEALKAIRALYPLENDIIEQGRPATTTSREPASRAVAGEHASDERRTTRRPAAPRRQPVRPRPSRRPRSTTSPS